MMVGPSTRQPQSTLMFAEAGESAQVVARGLSRNAAAIAEIASTLRSGPPTSVVTCARGSSDSAATYAKYLIETLIGAPTASAALSVTSLFAAQVHAEGSLCLAISQSGRSPDLLRTVEAHKSAGARIVVLVNDESSPLAALADHLLPLHAGAEQAVAATKSYVASLATLAALASAWAEDEVLAGRLARLPGELEEAFSRGWPEAEALLQNATNLFVLGRGYGFAVAQEAALKLKETCGLHAEAFSAAEVKHGPMALVGPGFPILAFATTDAAGGDVRSVATGFRDAGARVALMNDGGRLPAALQPIVQIQRFYRMANALAVARGFDPDAPPHLNKVTKTL